jgi:hypothetical protein
MGGQAAIPPRQQRQYPLNFSSHSIHNFSFPLPGHVVGEEGGNFNLLPGHHDSRLYLTRAAHPDNSFLAHVKVIESRDNSIYCILYTTAEEKLSHYFKDTRGGLFQKTLNVKISLMPRQ